MSDLLVEPAVSAVRHIDRRAAHQPRAGRVWSQEIPPEWERELRTFSRVRHDTSWLTFRWFPGLRRDRSGVWYDCGRWVLYECVPAALVPREELDILHMLADCPPSQLPTAQRHGRLLFVDDWMCAMYRQHRVWARACWVLQGSQGGHPIAYQLEEQAVLRARGLPTDPPPIGALPYAPFDARAKRQLIRRNKLIQVGNDLHALRQRGTAQAMRDEQNAAEKVYRAEYLDWLQATQEPQADFLEWYTRRSEHREEFPAASRAQGNASAALRDTFIETGALPQLASA